MRKIAAQFFITALLVGAALFAIGELPHSASAEFAQQGTYAGTSGGTANAQTISLPGLAVYSQLRGVQISWIVGSGLTNTGPATVNVNSLGAVNIYRRNGGALIQLGGAEMPAGDLVKATYDGTQFELDTDYTGGDLVGSIKAIDYSTADPGYALLNGACISTTANPAAYAKVGTIHNSQDGCSGSNFGVLDLRETILAGLGTMGGASDPGRITSAVSGFNPDAMGAFGGSQGYASGIAQTYLQSFTMTGSTTSSGGVYEAGDNVSWASGDTFTSGNLNVGVSVSSGGHGTAFPTLPYVQIVGYEMKL